MGNFCWVIRIGILGFKMSPSIYECQVIFVGSLGLVSWGLKCLPAFVDVWLLNWVSKCLPAFVGVR